MKEMLRAAWVIARRDFTAVVGSKAFIFFLIVPLILAGIFIAVAMVGLQASKGDMKPVIGLLLPRADADRLIATRDAFQRQIGGNVLPVLARVKGNPAMPAAGIEALLGDAGTGDAGYAAILSGSLDKPVLTASRANADRWQGRIALVIDVARHRDIAAGQKLAIRTLTRVTTPSDVPGQLITARIWQGGVFMLTLLLAGMVLSNLVEEKTGKIIEILAASVPIDAIFLGKLFAMLAMAFVAIGVWGASGAILQLPFGDNAPSLPQPGVGWPIFLMLAVAYFSTAYLLLGALLLGIGGMANTVREVQTLSMPVTMGQLLIFSLASYTVNATGEPAEVFAAVFPFSSPFAMVARAAQQPALLPHLLALAWQALWVWMTIRAGSALFRRMVLKSGRSRTVRKPASRMP